MVLKMIPVSSQFIIICVLIFYKFEQAYCSVSSSQQWASVYIVFIQIYLFLMRIKMPNKYYSTARPLIKAVISSLLLPRCSFIIEGTISRQE